jgi:dihydrolipoamide dehydrogenase
MQAEKTKGQGPDRRHRVPVQEEQGRLAEGPCRLHGRPTRSPSRARLTRQEIIIATGSSVTPLPGVEVDNDQGRHRRFHRRAGAAQGARASGRDRRRRDRAGTRLGLARLGAKVTVVEYLDQILPGMDGDVRKEAAKIFKKQGLESSSGTKVTGAPLSRARRPR